MESLSALAKTPWTRAAALLTRPHSCWSPPVAGLLCGIALHIHHRIGHGGVPTDKKQPDPAMNLALRESDDLLRADNHVRLLLLAPACQGAQATRHTHENKWRQQATRPHTRVALSLRRIWPSVRCPSAGGIDFALQAGTLEASSVRYLRSMRFA